MKQRYYSNIYWHFTGSPRGIDWSLCKKPNDILRQGKPLSPDESIQILYKILESQTLLATCSEKISKKISTQCFCCVTDIPLFDLELHAKYYGKVAIGYRANSIHNRFNPVLYYPNRKFPREYRFPEYNGNGPEFTVNDFDDIDTIFYNVKELENEKYLLVDKGKTGSLFCTEINSDAINNHFTHLIKVTDFSPTIGESFYQEREWRCLYDFHFKEESIEAVIVPNRLKKSLQKYLNDKDEYKHIAILTWEFLKHA